MKKSILALAVASAALFFCGCPLKVTVECDKDDNLSVNFSSELGEAFVESLEQIQQISAKNGQNSPNLDEISKKIQDELNAQVFKNARVQFKDGSLYASAQTNGAKKFPKEFLCVKKTADGKKTFNITLSKDSLAASILPEDSAARTLADVLMAPLLTGEEMPLQDYNDLLSEIYGEPLAKEILAGSLTVEFIDKPSGKKQSQKIPVADLLLLSETKISFKF